MTYSILALDRQSGAIGGAAITGNLAVGAWVLALSEQTGAVASQGLSASPLWRDQALDSLKRGGSAGHVVRNLVEADPGRGRRQLAVLDRQGRGSAWTGDGNHDVKGDLVGDDYVIAGNWLSTGDVLPAIERAFLKGTAMRFADRLLASLEAGLKAGGDARSIQSAAIKIASASEPPLDLRVDYHEDPLGQLKTLCRLTEEPDYAAWLETIPTLKEPHRC